jgi:quinohemoprotein amine dehydrogenase
MMKGVVRAIFSTFFLLLLFSFTVPAYGQPMFDKGAMVFQKCAACHKPNPQGSLDVIEETRKTPEEWKNVVDRMIRVNGAPLEDANFHAVIKELSRDLCLTPEEMAKIAYINSDENSQYREIPQNELEQQMYMACVRCHTWGKLASHRNTKSQWEEVRNLHLGYYPTITLQMRQMDWAAVSKELVEPLSNLFAFDTPGWRKWLENRKEEDLTGRWVVAGYQPGIGYYEGTYRFTADPSKGEDEYVVEKEIRYENGASLKTSGSATLFAK